MSEDDDNDAQLWAEYTELPLDPPPLRTLNHGGPGVCRLCHPALARTLRQPVQQGELVL